MRSVPAVIKQYAEIEQREAEDAAFAKRWDAEREARRQAEKDREKQAKAAEKATLRTKLAEKERREAIAAKYRRAWSSGGPMHQWRESKPRLLYDAFSEEFGSGHTIDVIHPGSAEKLWRSWIGEKAKTKLRGADDRTRRRVELARKVGKELGVYQTRRQRKGTENRTRRRRKRSGVSR